MKIPSIPIDAQEIIRLKQRFALRARAVFFARCVLLMVYFFIYFSPTSHIFIFNFSNLLAISILSLLFVSAFFAQKMASHEVYGRWANFISLSLEVAWLSHLIILNGGLTSPLLAAVPIYTILFSLLFHSAIATLPPLLILPIITALDLSDGIRLTLSEQILFLVYFSALNLICIFLTYYSLGREEHQSRQIRKLEQHLKALAVVEERHRLAREIHDGVGGLLSGLVIQSEYLISLLANEPIKTREAQEIKHTAEEAMEEIRRALAMMYDDFELIPQLQNTCSSFTLRHKVPVNLKVDGDPPTFSNEKQLTIFRIMQECLTNIAKHARADKVDVNLKFEALGMDLEIRDNGVGFDPTMTPKNHYGLINLKDRAKRVGGYLTIDSAPGQGTKVDLRINAQ